jgi:hypothetical protein
MSWFSGKSIEVAMVIFLEGSVSQEKLESGQLNDFCA